MQITQLLKANRLPRRQKGQRFETRTAFFLRYYYTTENGTRKQKAVLIAYKSDLYRSWSDVEPLIAAELRKINNPVEAAPPSGSVNLSEFIEHDYLRWCEANKSAPTANGYRRIWERDLKPDLGRGTLVGLSTATVTNVLTKHARAGKSSRTLSHIKWMLSGVYVYAISRGIVPLNPVPEARWLVKVARTKQQAEYSLKTVLQMLRVLEGLDIRAAVAVALAYFAALRPAEIRGLQWTDYDGQELQVKRAVWRGIVGETKTESSAASVPVIEPLRSLLEKLRTVSPAGYILQYGSGKPLSLDSLNYRLIAPALKAAGIEWHGYYPCRRGISSQVTDTSKNALNSTGLLRHSTPITALKHYTRAQKESIVAAMKVIEEQAAEILQEEKVSK